MFFSKTLLLLSSLVGSALSASPQAGTSSGYSLKFQGDGEIAAFRHSFADISEDQYPSTLGGMTFSVWIKTSYPRTLGGKMSIWSDFTIPFITNLFMAPNPQNPDGDIEMSFATPNFNYGKTGHTFEEFLDTWHHLAWTFQHNCTNVAEYEADPTNVIKTFGDPVAEWVMYFDGVEINRDSNYHQTKDWDLHTGIGIGAYVWMSGDFVNINLQPDHFHGYMDEIAFYNRALSPAEISAQYMHPQTGAEDGLAMLYNFDDAYDQDYEPNKKDGATTSFDLLFGQTYQGTSHIGTADRNAADGVGGGICRLTTDGPLIYCEQLKRPAVANSGVPFASGTGLDYVVNVNPADLEVTFTMPGSDADGDALTFATTSTPTIGTLSDLVVADGTITYSWTSADVAVGSDTFTYSVTSDVDGESASAKVRIIFAQTPTAGDFPLDVIEDAGTGFVLRSYDPIGLPVTWTLLSVPEHGELFELDGFQREVNVDSNNETVALTAADMPKVLNSPNLRYASAPDKVDDYSFTYSVLNSVGQVSDVSTVTISFTTVMDLPLTQGTLSETDPLGLISLDLAVSDPDSQATTLMITSLPLNGKLYHKNFDGSKGEEIEKAFSSFNVMAPIAQYAKEVVEYSSFWPDGTNAYNDRPRWHPDQLLDEPDAVQVNADSILAACFASMSGADYEACDCQIFSGDTLSVWGEADFSIPAVSLGFGAWQGNEVDMHTGSTKTQSKDAWVNDMCWNAWTSYVNNGFSDFFTIRFEEQVYLQSIEVGENRGMGSIIDIEAYEWRSKSWYSVWNMPADPTIEARFKKTGQYRINLPYPICQPSFKTDIYRFKVDTVTVVDWNEFDYVKIQGSVDLGPGILPSGITSVFYEAPEEFDAIDSFTYSATDCGYYADRQSPDQVVQVAPTGNSVTTFPTAVADTDILVSSATAVVDVVEDLLLPNHDLVFIDQVPGTCTLGQNGNFTVVTFAWTQVDSDVLEYTCTYLATSTVDGVVSKGTITFTLDENVVRKKDDVRFVVSDCTNDNVREIEFFWSAEILQTALGGKSLPDNLKEPCTEVPAGSKAGALITILALLGFIICLAFTIMVGLKKKHPVIKASQPLFCMNFAFGCALICLQMITFLGDANDGTCTTRLWVYNLCFVGAFGSLFIKTWRVWRVFSNSAFKRVKLSNADTIRIMSILMGIEVIILGLGQVLAPYKAVTKEVQIPFQEGRYYSTTVCESETGEFQLLDSAYKVVLVVGGCYLSWTTRNVDSAFAESKQIMFAIYQVAIYGLLAFIIITAGVDIDTTLTIQTICCVFGAICCVACVLLPKFVLINSGQHDSVVLSSSENTSSGTSSSNSSSVVSATSTASSYEEGDGGSKVAPEA